MQPVKLTRPLINIDHRHASHNEPIIDTFRPLSAVAVLNPCQVPKAGGGERLHLAVIVVQQSQVEILRLSPVAVAV
jgi:hypothetical protein